MKKFFDDNGIGAIVIAAVLLVGAYYLFSGTKPPVKKTATGLDSTAYYKNLEQQGKLNYEFYTKLKSLEQQVIDVQKDLNHEKKRINGLHGADLQREVDRQFNQPSGNREADSQPLRQPQTAQPRTGSQTDHADRGGSAGGPPIPRRSAGEPGHDCPERFAVAGERRSDYQAEPADHPAQRAAAGKAERRPAIAEPGRRLPDEVARSTVGELGMANRNSPVYSREAQTHLTYWRLIQSQRYIYPDVAWAISAAETGYWWSSAELAKHGHNLFGMKKNSRGYYIGVSAGGYCLYASPRMSLGDYGGYEADVIRRYNITSQASYVAHICKRFCPNPAYPGKLALAFQKLKRTKSLA